MKKLLALFLLVSLFALSACNTVTEANTQNTTMGEPTTTPTTQSSTEQTTTTEVPIAQEPNTVTTQSPESSTQSATTETPIAQSSTTRTTTKEYVYNYEAPKRCAASPCPNNAVAGSSYCSVHKSGKTKRCAQCGTAIWADETYCDSCLFGAFF